MPYSPLESSGPGDDIARLKEKHAQKIARLRAEYAPRYMRYRNDPLVWPLVEKLMELKPGQDHNLTSEEVERLDKKMRPIRMIRARQNEALSHG